MWTSCAIAHLSSKAAAAPSEARAVWEKTLSEVDKDLSIGPLTRAQLDNTWGYGRWRAMMRHGVWQKDKLRPVDDRRSSLHNAITRTRESLRCCRAEQTTRSYGLLGTPVKQPAEALLQTGLGAKGQDIDLWRRS